MITIRFNTGRKYTAAGQRIVATYRPHNEAEDEGGTVTFMDHDRQGRRRVRDHQRDCSSTQTVIMGAYDTYRAPRAPSALGRTACSAADATPI